MRKGRQKQETNKEGTARSQVSETRTLASEEGERLVRKGRPEHRKVRQEPG